MFTGLVETTGTVSGVRHGKHNKKSVLVIDAPPKIARSLKKGASLSVQGVCLTLVSKRAGAPLLTFNLVRETLRRSTLGNLRKGDRVNLERPLKWNGRLEGHFVLGHVEAVGVVKKVLSKGREKSVRIAFPPGLRRSILEKGSIAIDGVSLTVGKTDGRAFWVHLIPHTLKLTSLSALVPGARVNLETDILAKFQVPGRPKS